MLKTGIILQGFNWKSHENKNLYKHLEKTVPKMKNMKVEKVWLPPSSKSRDPEGYYPLDYYNHESEYGTSDELQSLIDTFRENEIDVIGELVCWTNFCGHIREPFGFKEELVAIDSHTLYDYYEDYLLHMKDIGFTDIRVDFLKSPECYNLGLYVASLDSLHDLNFVGEYWTDMSYEGEYLMNNQNEHRQEIVNFIDKSNWRFSMFDFTLKGVLQCALNNREYWRLSDERQLPPGANGWVGENAITFLDNHDTLGQHLWEFSRNRDVIMAGYAYIMTHCGTPCVYYDHFFDYHHELEKLASIRSQMKNDSVVIIQASHDVYKACVGEEFFVQIGEGCSFELDCDTMFQTSLVLIQKKQHLKKQE